MRNISVLLTISGFLALAQVPNSNRTHPPAPAAQSKGPSAGKQATVPFEAAIKQCEAKDTPAETERCLRILVSHNPASAALHEKLADFLGANKSSPAAVESELRAAVRLAPSNAGFTASLIRFLLNSGETDKADPLSKQATATWPKDPELAALRGALLVHKRNIEGAKVQYQKAAALAPDRRRRYLSAFASELEQIGERTEAIAVMRQAVASAPPLRSRETERVHNQLANLLEQEKRWSEAEGEYTAADQASYLSSNFNLRMFAERLEKQGETDRAIQIYLKIVKSSTLGDSLASTSLLTLLSKSGNWTQLNSICADAARSIGSGSLRMDCESTVEKLIPMNNGEIAMGLFRAMKNAQFSPSGYSPLLMKTGDLARARLAAGSTEDVAELCDVSSFELGRCNQVIKSVLAGDDFELALRLYRSLAKHQPGTGLRDYGPLADLKNELGVRLANNNRMTEAASLCSDVSSSNSCASIIEALLKAGKRDVAVRFIVDQRIRSTAKYHPGLSLEDKVALEVAEAKVSRTGLEPINTFGLGFYFSDMKKQGKLVDAGKALRDVAAGLDIGEFSQTMLSAGIGAVGTSWAEDLIRNGDLVPKVKTTTALLDRYCRAQGKQVFSGQVLNLAMEGGASCNGGVFSDIILVEYEGRVWGISTKDVDLVVADPSAPVAPRLAKTVEQLLARLAGPVPSVNGAEFLDEVTLGLAAEKDVLSNHEEYDDAETKEAGTAAFRRLMETSFARSGNVPSFQLFLLKDNSVNAFSTAGGRVFVNKGMLPVVGKDSAMWAAVIAHEVGHVVAHHQYKHYVRQIQLRALQQELARQAATGNKVAQWAWIFSKTGGPLLNNKFSRDEENEADRRGLLMMAEAGYHPDFVLDLIGRLKRQGGDKGKVATFISSDHPRWETREKKVKEAYAEALRIFSARWPDAASSPGGAPPKSR